MKIFAIDSSRTCLRGVTALAMLAFVGVAQTRAADPGDELVEMCHRGTSIMVQRRFVPARLAAGDTLGPCDPCSAGDGIRFDRPAYEVAPGTAFVAKVIICPPPPAGLFSFGVEVTLEGGNFSGTGLGISVPGDLNHHTVLGGGADLATGSMIVSAKGSVDFFREPIVTYKDKVLAEIHVTGLPAGTYSLKVASHNDLGATEQIFVDGNCAVLDPVLRYTSSAVVVGGGPSTTALTGIANPQDPANFPHLSIQSGDNGKALTLRFQPKVGEKYAFQYSDDLAKWTTVLPAISGAQLPVEWTDPGPPQTHPAPSATAKRFYRLLPFDMDTTR